MDNMDYGDEIYYSDSGTELKPAFPQLAQLLQNSDILVEKNPERKERDYSKADLLKALDMLYLLNDTSKHQIEGSLIILKKSLFTEELIRDW